MGIASLSNAFFLYFNHLIKGTPGLHEHSHIHEDELIESHQPILYFVFGAVISTLATIVVIICIISRTIILWRLKRKEAVHVYRYTVNNPYNIYGTDGEGDDFSDDEDDLINMYLSNQSINIPVYEKPTYRDRIVHIYKTIYRAYLNLFQSITKYFPVKINLFKTSQSNVYKPIYKAQKSIKLHAEGKSQSLTSLDTIGQNCEATKNADDELHEIKLVKSVSASEIIHAQNVKGKKSYENLISIKIRECRLRIRKKKEIKSKIKYRIDTGRDDKDYETNQKDEFELKQFFARMKPELVDA